MAQAFITVDEYRELTGDTKTSGETLSTLIAEQSAELRLAVPISKPIEQLTDDQLALCKKLVRLSVKNACVPATIGSIAEALGDVSGVKEASFTANGFTGSVTLSNANGTAYFDRATLKALRLSLGQASRVGYAYAGAGKQVKR